MKRRHFRIRRWLVLAVALVALALPAASQARLVLYEDGGAAPPKQSQPVTVTTGGFQWGDALIGAGVALGIVLSGVVIVQAGRNRRRLATLL